MSVIQRWVAGSVAAVVLAACSDGASRVTDPSQVDSGWTEFSPVPGALTIHVSSAGDDAWPGTVAQPKRTLAAGFAALRDGEPDWLLLRRGDVFTLTGAFTWSKTGPSDDDLGGWMRLGAYGSEDDPRPILDSGDQPGLVVSPGVQSSKQIRNLAITDIHLRASTRLNDPASAMTAPVGIQVVATQFQAPGPSIARLLIENVMIQGYGLGFNGSATEIMDLRVRRSIFHYIFTPDGAAGGAQGWIAAPTGALLEDNIFYQIQSDDIPGVVAEAYSEFLHSAYIPAEATNIATRGNIVIKATDALMQRPGGDYVRNVGVQCRIAGLLGQAWGVTPTPGGVGVIFEESLLLNAFNEPFYLGNTGAGEVRDNLFLRDQGGAVNVGLTLVPQNAQGAGVNIGVHNTQFENNVLSGSLAWNPQDNASFSGLTFTNNLENQGQIGTNIAAYLNSIGWSGSTVDDWARRLITRDRANYGPDYTSLSIINFYRAVVGRPLLN
jgi:hypothetical protein